MKMSKRHFYINAGSKSGLESVLPGVKTVVLGPPTVEQSNTITKMRSTDPDEFWHLLGLAGQSLVRGKGNLFPRSETYGAPRPEQMAHPPDADFARRTMLELVRALYSVMNNRVSFCYPGGKQKVSVSGDGQPRTGPMPQQGKKTKAASERQRLQGRHTQPQRDAQEPLELFTNRSATSSPKASVRGLDHVRQTRHQQ